MAEREYERVPTHIPDTDHAGVGSLTYKIFVLKRDMSVGIYPFLCEKKIFCRHF